MFYVYILQIQRKDYHYVGLNGLIIILLYDRLTFFLSLS